MDKIQEYMRNITNVKFVDIIIAICIIIFFIVSSSTISYIIIRIFKIEGKSKKKIKASSFYKPLKTFFSILGIYIAIMSLKLSYDIPEKFINVVTKLFEICSVLVFAKAFAKSCLPGSTLVKKIKANTKQDVEDSMFDFILKIVRIIIYIIAGFTIITILGVNLNGLVAGLGIGGVIITLAAQDTAKNLFGGLVIFIDKPFVVGDWIQIDAFEGTVEDITFRSTRIRTFENSLVNIPNSTMSDSSIVNWSKMEKRRYKTNLCIQLNTPLEKIEKFMARVREMLQQRDAIFDETILVKFEEITDNGVSILISSYTDSVDYTSYLTERQNINTKIMKILKEENIELAYDTKTVYIRN